MADPVRYLPALLPLVATVLCVLACRPRGGDVVAPLRLAVVRGGVTVGAVAVCGVELLSAMKRIDGPSIATFWVVVVAAAAAAALARQRTTTPANQQAATPANQQAATPPGQQATTPENEQRTTSATQQATTPATQQATTPVSQQETTPPGRQGATQPGRHRTTPADHPGHDDAPRAPQWWRDLRLPERAMLVAMAGLVLAELLLALASAPNNYDSNYYHLPKIEHWVADHDVDVFPTLQLQLVTFVPGTEYLLLHLRLLTGNDGIYNLVQWLAGIGAAIAVSRIAAQLGADRLGQWIAGALVVGTPMVVLEATSTQTDLAVSAWLLCAASLAVDGVLRRATVADVLVLGAAGGLVAITKSTGLMGLGPMLILWGTGQLRLRWRTGRPRWRGVPRTAAAALAVVIVGLLVVGPFMLRMERTFGNPLGSREYNDSLQMQRHDPPALAVNALRILTSTVVVPLPAVNTAVAGAVVRLSHALGVDPNADAITVGVHPYPDPRWWPDEDHSPYPIPSVLMLLAVAASLVARRVPAPVRGYAGAVLLDLVLTVWVLRWQLWGNRLLLTQLLLGLPLAGWWLGRLATGPRRPWRSIVSGAIAVVVAAGLFWGYDAVLLGRPRRLVGQGSTFTQSEWTQRFARQPDRLGAYERAADLVRRSGAHRVGTVVLADQWEYPLWKLLPGRDFVSVSSSVPGEPPASPSSVGAIVCLASVPDCTRSVPAGWRYTQVDSLLAVMVPAGAGPS